MKLSLLSVFVCLVAGCAAMPAQVVIVTGQVPAQATMFSPPAGTYVGAQSISIAGPAGTHSFYTADGSPATEASTLYSAPFTLSASGTINALAILPPTTQAQSLQTCNTSTCWKTQLACSSTQCSPYTANYNTPGLAYGSGSGCNAGVCGIPTAIGYVTGVASPSLSGNATHLSFQTEKISGAGSQTQVLWANKQAACDSCTYQVEDFYMYPGETYTGIWALESDMVLWDGTRGLIKSAALQCLLSSGKWQFNGQAGSWNDFGKDQNNNAIVYYKNGVAQTAGATLTEGCSTSTTGWTHVQYHATFNPGVTDATCKNVSTGANTECIYIDYLTINGDKYTFGTTTTHDANGNTITVSILKVPAAALPGGYPARCFNQLQIDTAGTGASTSNPITYGMYYDRVNMSCGTGAPSSTGSATYTIN